MGPGQHVGTRARFPVPIVGGPAHCSKAPALSLGHRLGRDGLEHDDLAALLVGNRCKHPLAGLVTKKSGIRIPELAGFRGDEASLGRQRLQIRLSGLNERACAFVCARVMMN